MPFLPTLEIILKLFSFLRNEMGFCSYHINFIIWSCFSYYHLYFWRNSNCILELLLQIQFISSAYFGSQFWDQKADFNLSFHFTEKRTAFKLFKQLYLESKGINICEQHQEKFGRYLGQELPFALNTMLSCCFIAMCTSSRTFPIQATSWVPSAATGGLSSYSTNENYHWVWMSDFFFTVF